jgi:hypothetical protein
MMLAGILLTERAVEELAFLLLDADEFDLALRLTHALEHRAPVVAFSEDDRMAILSAIIHEPRGLTELRSFLLDTWGHQPEELAD